MLHPLPEQHCACPAFTCQLPLESHRLTKPDKIPDNSLWSLATGSVFLDTTGTNNLAATAPCNSLIDGGAEHGPLGLNFSDLPWNAVEALAEVEVATGSQCTLTIHLGVLVLSIILPPPHP